MTLDEYIKNQLNTLESNILDIEKYLYDDLGELNFDYENNNIVFNQKNLNISRIENIFEKHQKKIISFILIYISSLKYIDKYHLKYYQDLGFEKKILEKINKQLTFLMEKVGISNNIIIKDGFLDKLLSLNEVKIEIQNYILRSVASGKNINDFYNGLKLLIKTTEHDGTLMRYLKTYLFDVISQYEAIGNNFIANKLGLTKFKYVGEIIKGTRTFCLERVNKEFTKEDGISWNKLDWKGKIPEVDFFIQRGGYNCIHRIEWFA
jgi:hypothetical protein